MRDEEKDKSKDNEAKAPYFTHSVVSDQQISKTTVIGVYCNVGTKWHEEKQE